MWQKLKTIRSKTSYEKYFKGSGKLVEDPRANPDVLSNESQKSEWELDLLDELKQMDIKTLLNRDEWKVLNLLIYEDKTVTEVMKEMKKRRETVNKLFNSAIEKLRRRLNIAHTKADSSFGRG